MYGERNFEGGRGNRGGNNDRSQDRQMTPPVREGEEIDVTIEAVGEKGDGIAKKAGFVIFVPGTKVGDKVKIRVKKVAKKVAFADVIGQATETQPEESESQEAETQEVEEEQESYDASQDSEEF